MVLGFNHNVMYRGEVFHVQTEDSGVAIPHIITLLYRGGVILCSQKTSYADILKIDNLETVVEELMKEQHKAMMRRLKSGEFDERAFPSGTPSSGVDCEPQPSSDNADDEIDLSTPSDGVVLPYSTEDIFPFEEQATRPEPDVSGTDANQDANQDGAPKEPESLDDAILAFFAANEK